MCKIKLFLYIFLINFAFNYIKLRVHAVPVTNNDDDNNDNNINNAVNATNNNINNNNNNNYTTIFKDDFSTEWAKKIVRISKSAEINVILDKTIDPCTDFYKYSCGNWHRNNPAQLLANIMTDKFHMLANGFDRRLARIFNSTAKNVPQLEQKVRHFYQSCQLAKNDDVMYKMHLQNVFKEFASLPVLEGEHWKESEFNWWEIVAKIQRKYGKQIILAVDIMGDIENNKENRVYIGAPDYTVAADSKIFNLLHEAKTVKDLQDYFGVEHSLAKKTAKEMITFEKELVQGGTNVRLGLSLKEMLTLKDLKNLTNTFIPDFLKVLLEQELPEKIYIYDEKYLANALKTIADKPKRILANYIIWQWLQDYLIDADEKNISKWCIERTKKVFGKLIDFIGYQGYKSVKVEQQVFTLFEEIRDTFRDELKGDKLDWISNATREYAIEKLNAMTLEINSYEKENFSELYGAITINQLNYIKNLQEIFIVNARKNANKLHNPPTSLEDVEVLSYTPSYSILENIIKVPVSLLQPHYFWNDNYPQSLKYATLGYLLAHELIHGFDDEGRKYDKDGNFHNWWDIKSTYEFEARRKCFQAQYHTYKYGGKLLPESVSQSENIADNAGVKLAYAAYMRWINQQKAIDADIEKKETFAGLNFDNRQLFFVSFAQVWCEDVQSLFKTTVVSGDMHAPGMYRVIGSLSNFQEFSWVFQCKPDAQMDPEYKCAIY